ncbi:protein of unknown function [Paenibacillus alvei]|uniref:Uncharacterized protein n=1 Tax=Paenibacillus alvei TaxID=44250 RepID=A0A383REG6_PAEAL|nr:protein of unknown function [Paenibacillus alvei]
MDGEYLCKREVSIHLSSYLTYAKSMQFTENILVVGFICHMQMGIMLMCDYCEIKYIPVSSINHALRRIRRAFLR